MTEEEVLEAKRIQLRGMYRKIFGSTGGEAVLADLTIYASLADEPAVRCGRQDILTRIMGQLYEED